MKHSSLGTKILNAPYILWSVLFIIVPLVIVVYFAFTDQNGAWTLANIAEIKDYGEILLRSIGYAVVATLITLVTSYPVAYFMSKAKARTQAIMMMLIMLPMWMNLLIRKSAKKVKS